MNQKNKLENSNYIISYDASFEEAMQAITANRRGAIIVVDTAMHLVGVVSDGDIRRAMLKGAIMQTPIRQAINYNIVFVLDTDAKTLKNKQKLLDEHEHINLFPIVDKKNIVVDVIIRGGSAEE